jgi:hypothetical protein
VPTHRLQHNQGDVEQIANQQLRQTLSTSETRPIIEMRPAPKLTLLEDGPDQHGGRVVGASKNPHVTL